MVSAFSLNISSMSKFWGIKITQKNALSIDMDRCRPAFFVSGNSDKSSFVVSMRSMQILMVDRLANIAEIAKAVVARIAVNMVNMIGRIFSSHVKPSKTVAVMQFAIKSKNDIVASIFSSDNVANFGLFADCHDSSKQTSSRIVGKNRFEAFLGQHSMLHCCK